MSIPSLAIEQISEQFLNSDQLVPARPGAISCTCNLLLIVIHLLLIMIMNSTLIHKPQTPGEIATFDRQTRFLDNFARLGTTLKAAKAAGIDRGTVYNWLDEDKYGFRQRMEYTHLDFAEAVEDVVFHDVFGPKPHPILLMFTAKAHNRAKYGDQVVVINDKASELLAAVRGLPSANVVEGEVVEVSGGELVRESMEKAGG